MLAAIVSAVKRRALEGHPPPYSSVLWKSPTSEQMYRALYCLGFWPLPCLTVSMYCCRPLGPAGQALAWLINGNVVLEWCVKIVLMINGESNTEVVCYVQQCMAEP